MTGLSGEELTSTLGARSRRMPSAVSSAPMAAAAARVVADVVEPPEHARCRRRSSPAG